MLILKQENYNDDELRMIYDYLLFLDYEILFSYFMNNTIHGYDNDLCVYIEVIGETIKKFELTEEYEKCCKLKLKREEAIKIINDYKIN
jgi:hypothetical protein